MYKTQRTFPHPQNRNSNKKQRKWRRNHQRNNSKEFPQLKNLSSAQNDSWTQIQVKAHRDEIP